MIKYKMCAPCLFGVEGILSEELKRLGAENIKCENGRVMFDGDMNILAAANIQLRTAERVLLVIGAFNAVSFEELFNNVNSLEWERFLSRTDAFPVVGYSIASALHSVPDCQSIIKKAIVKRLQKAYGISWFEETGALHKVRFSIHKNEVMVAIDTSGEGLHKRGYRSNSVIAPIKETLAAAMCYLVRIYPDTQLYDPFCGSGTILIEAAMMAKNLAPGMHRFFAAERFNSEFKEAFAKCRTQALNSVKNNISFCAYGSDIDNEAVRLTLENAKKAGVSELVKAKTGDVSQLEFQSERLLLITNPPYGERLLDVKAAESLYKLMGKKMPKESGKKYFIISPHDEFEHFFGRSADKRRKLYNGMLKCQVFMYFKGERT